MYLICKQTPIYFFQFIWFQFFFILRFMRKEFQTRRKKKNQSIEQIKENQLRNALYIGHYHNTNANYWNDFDFVHPIKSKRIIAFYILGQQSNQT